HSYPLSLHDALPILSYSPGTVSDWVSWGAVSYSAVLTSDWVSWGAASSSCSVVTTPDSCTSPACRLCGCAPVFSLEAVWLPGCRSEEHTSELQSLAY